MKKSKESFTRFVKLWPEIWSIPIALLCWYLSPDILHYLDPTAATFDAGILQVPIYAILLIVLYNGIAWLGMKFNFPALFQHYIYSANKDLEQITPWQRLKLLCSVYFGLLYALLLAAKLL